MHSTVSRSKQAITAPAVCAACGAVFTRSGWTRGEPAMEIIRRWHGQPLQVRFCPECTRRRNALPRGG